MKGSLADGKRMWNDDVLCLCVSEGDRGPMPQRGPYQRAMSMDSKPMGGQEGGGGLAGRRNVPCPTLVKQENMEAPSRSGPVPNGFPGGIGMCSPRGNPSSNDNHVVSVLSFFFFSLHSHLAPPSCPQGAMGRGMGMAQRPPMSGPGDWGMPRSSGSPVPRPGHPGMGRTGPMSGPMVNRSNSVPGNPRSMLQQQLMDMGKSTMWNTARNVFPFWHEADHKLPRRSRGQVPTKPTSE